MLLDDGGLQSTPEGTVAPPPEGKQSQAGTAGGGGGGSDPNMRVAGRAGGFDYAQLKYSVFFFGLLSGSDCLGSSLR